MTNPKKRQREGWVDEPLQRTIREGLRQRGWNLSDLSRAMGGTPAPSLVSRWMSGTRPSAEMLTRVAEVLGLDVQLLLFQAGYTNENPMDEEDPRRTAIIAKVRLIDITEERYALLDSLLETMRRRRVPIECSERPSALPA